MYADASMSDGLNKLRTVSGTQYVLNKLGCKHRREHRQRETNNLFVPKSLSLTLSAFWVFFGGILVCSGDITMGTFLAEWDIIKQIGHCWQSPPQQSCSRK